MVRTRIAPSPTGYLHIGTARTALYNYLFARRNTGTFILRIEDTDIERSRTEFERDICEGLTWLGICWDEGPGTNGSYGPYRQSERNAIYTQYLYELFEKDLVYHCYCTTEELEQEREFQTLAKLSPRYSGKCRKLSDADRKKWEREGRTSTLRFRMSQEVVIINDLIRGELTFDTATLDDFIIAKNLETPLYNFAVVVDDYLMKITHVIRGEDHISNTPKQILLARSLGFETPQFGHLPLILNTDRTKLSKRENKVSLLDYRKDGYLPEAIVNFMVMLGWSCKDGRELFLLAELEQHFELSQVHKAGAVFNIAKLDWFNAYYIRQKPLQELAALCIPYLIDAGYISKEPEGDSYRIPVTGRVVSYAYLERLISLEQGRIRRLSDIVDATAYFFAARPLTNPALLCWKDMTIPDALAQLSFAYDTFESCNDTQFTSTELEDTMKRAIAAFGKKNGEVLWPLRVALTGRAASPSPFDVAYVLGKEETLRRIAAARESHTGA